VAAIRSAETSRYASLPADLRWLNAEGADMTVADWEAPGADRLGWTADGQGAVLDRGTRTAIIGRVPEGRA
jgi:glycogen operon protein